MILWFLGLFPEFRRLHGQVAHLEKRLKRSHRAIHVAEARAAAAEQRERDLLGMFEREVADHKSDLRKTADTFARPVTGRYAFARVSDVEAEITSQPRQPLPGKRYAGDVARERTQQFFEGLLNGKSHDTNAGNGAATAA